MLYTDDTQRSSGEGKVGHVIWEYEIMGLGVMKPAEYGNETQCLGEGKSNGVSTKEIERRKQLYDFHQGCKKEKTLKKGKGAVKRQRRWFKGGDDSGRLEEV
jgi:hypothetical protein